MTEKYFTVLFIYTHTTSSLSIHLMTGTWIVSVSWQLLMMPWWTVRGGVAGLFLSSFSQSLVKDFPGGSECKESTCSAGDLGLIPGLGRSSGGGHGNPLQYSCLENPHGWRSLGGHIPWGHKESDTTERISTYRFVGQIIRSGMMAGWYVSSVLNFLRYLLNCFPGGGEYAVRHGEVEI